MIWLVSEVSGQNISKIMCFSFQSLNLKGQSQMSLLNWVCHADCTGGSKSCMVWEGCLNL